MSRAQHKRYTLHEQKRTLGLVVKVMLDLADVRLDFTWSDKPTIGYTVESLFGALALQLMLTVSGSRGFWFCGASRLSGV